MTLYADADKDGFGDPETSMQACEGQEGYVAQDGDCDDNNDKVYAGADEVCDSLDNDCDEAIDEYSETNTDSCDGCKMEAHEDNVFYFCQGPASWENARARCLRRGADLVSINSNAELDAVWTVLKSDESGLAHWFGASDREQEGTYLWLDGTILSSKDTHWAIGQPKANPGLDCVVLSTSNEYEMRPCDPEPELPWVCEGLLR